VSGWGDRPGSCCRVGIDAEPVGRAAVPTRRVGRKGNPPMTTQGKRSGRRQPGGTAPSGPPEEVVDRLAGLLPGEELERALEGLDPEQVTGPGGLVSQLAGRGAREPAADRPRRAWGRVVEPGLAGPALKVVGQAGDHGPGTVGGEAAGGEVGERPVLEVADRELALAVLAVLSRSASRTSCERLVMKAK
jgi:hypothetical protein